MKGCMTMRRWTQEEIQFLNRLTHGAKRNTWKKWTKQMNEHFDSDRTWQQLRAYWRNNLQDDTGVKISAPEYKEEVEILGNGNIKSDKLVELSLEQAKDPQYLLEAHGFDPREFELTNAKSSQWNHSNKEQGTMVQYSSKITVKPIKQKIDYDSIIRSLEDSKEPYTPQVVPLEDADERYIVVPSFDTHFDGKTLETYRESLGKMLSTIAEGTYKESLLILGGDIVHVDSINNQTTKGTMLESTDIAATFDEMEEFYESIIQVLLKYSEKVKVMQLNGNHDNTLGYAFARILQRAYRDHSNVEFDVSLEQRKATMLGNNMICGSHGDKASAKYPQLFATEFAQEWASATNRELITGHLHHEVVKDEGGILHRQAPTQKEPDKWHRENGFTMASHRFQLITYTKDSTDSVIYI